MTDQQQDNISNATESGFIGFAVSFFLNQVLPWTIHTVGAIASGLIVAFCVYKFNKWMKNTDK